MSTIVRKSLSAAVLLALVYATPVLAVNDHKEQLHNQTSESHKGGMFKAAPSTVEKSPSKVSVNQEYPAKDERVFSWSDSSLGWVFALALFGFVLMSNRNRV
jgi:hypothetical protein